MAWCWQSDMRSRIELCCQAAPSVGPLSDPRTRQEAGIIAASLVDCMFGPSSGPTVCNVFIPASRNLATHTWSCRPMPPQSCLERQGSITSIHASGMLAMLHICRFETSCSCLQHQGCKLTKICHAAAGQAARVARQAHAHTGLAGAQVSRLWYILIFLGCRVHTLKPCPMPR